MSAEGDAIRAEADTVKAQAAAIRSNLSSLLNAMAAPLGELDQTATDLVALASKVDPLVLPPPPQPVPTPGWTDVFRDDFSGTTLDTTKWVYEGTLMNVKPNGTQQLDGPNLPRNVSVAGGELVLQAKRETYVVNGVTYQWTSSGIQSKDAVLTKGTRMIFDWHTDIISGMSPGWWSSSQVDDGEFDGPELFGNAADIKTSCMRFAGFKSYSPMVLSKYNVIPADTKPHRTITDWKADNSVDFYLDDKKVHTIPASYGLPQTPHRLRVTLQCGGNPQWRGAIPADVNLMRCWTSSVAVQKPA